MHSEEPRQLKYYQSLLVIKMFVNLLWHNCYWKNQTTPLILNTVLFAMHRMFAPRHRTKKLRSFTPIQKINHVGHDYRCSSWTILLQRMTSSQRGVFTGKNNRFTWTSGQISVLLNETRPFPAQTQHCTWKQITRITTVQSLRKIAVKTDFPYFETPTTYILGSLWTKCYFS